jgi:DNA ligase (NAD+)
MQAGLIHDPADVFLLSREELLPLPRMGRKLVESLLGEIDRCRSPRLDKLIFGLGVPGVGDHVAEVLASHFQSMDALRSADLPQLTAIPEIGPTTAGAIREFFTRQTTVDLLEKLGKAGVQPVPPPKPRRSRLSGKSVVFTGTMSSMSRERALALVRQMGGKTPASVSRSTDYLVAGRDPGSKLGKAKALGVEVLDEEGFLELQREAT